LALGQLALYVATGLVALSLSPADLGFMSVILSSSGWFLVFFVTGFLIVTAVYAALGAMAQKAEDLQSSQTPIMVLLMITLFAGMLAKDLWLVVASYVPVVSSVAMPVRMLQTSVPLWQTLVSLALSLATALLLIRLGGKIFRLAVLHTSGALGFKAALALKD
jgi:ABC-2 type transport system permease protein